MSYRGTSPMGAESHDDGVVRRKPNVNISRSGKWAAVPAARPGTRTRAATQTPRRTTATMSLSGGRVCIRIWLPSQGKNSYFSIMADEKATSADVQKEIFLRVAKRGIVGATTDTHRVVTKRAPQKDLTSLSTAAQHFKKNESRELILLPIKEDISSGPSEAAEADADLSVSVQRILDNLIEASEITEKEGVLLARQLDEEGICSLHDLRALSLEELRQFGVPGTKRERVLSVMKKLSSAVSSPTSAAGPPAGAAEELDGEREASSPRGVGAKEKGANGVEDKQEKRKTLMGTIRKLRFKRYPTKQIDPGALTLDDGERGEQYDVIKVNLRGRKQRRVLRLGEHDLQNIRGNVVSARHKYSEVFSVTLQDAQTIVISFLSDHDYVYISPIAVQIVHQINERLAGRRKREKSLFTNNIVNIPFKYQEKVLGDPKTGSSALRMPKGMAPPPRDHVRMSSMEVRGTMSKKTSEELLALLKAKAQPKKGPETKQSSKLAKLTGAATDQRVRQAIDMMLCDSTTEEGRARARFLKNFAVLEKEPDTLLAVLRQFMDALRSFVEANRSAEIHKLRGGTLGTGSFAHLAKARTQQEAAEAAAEMEKKMDEAARQHVYIEIERSVQHAVTQPLYRRIKAILELQTKNRDALITAQVKQLMSKGQNFFGIKPEHQSKSNWSTAVYELGRLTDRILPVEMLEVLLSTARAVYNEYNYERNRQEIQAGLDRGEAVPIKHYYVAADDFFPIFVFVVVKAHAKVERFELWKEFMMGLNDQAALNGEGGYYLTVFSAVLEYIARLDVFEAAKEAEERKKQWAIEAEKRAKREAEAHAERLKREKTEADPFVGAAGSALGTRPTDDAGKKKKHASRKVSVAVQEAAELPEKVESRVRRTSEESRSAAERLNRRRSEAVVLE